MSVDVSAVLLPIVRARAEIEVAALFGSAAQGRLRPDSDVAICAELAQSI